MWSKVLSLHPDVYGWDELNTTYWIGHDREPFNLYWKNPELLKQFDWTVSDYYMTSISVPYMENGVPTIPNFTEFIAELEQLNIRVIIGVIGRDKNILSMQEQRLRGGETYTRAVECFKQLPLDKIYFLSHELLLLYRQQYLNKISMDLNFPIVKESNQLEEILSDNANEKYLRPIEGHWVDDLARASSRKWR
jgi:hypothetical protein